MPLIHSPIIQNSNFRKIIKHGKLLITPWINNQSYLVTQSWTQPGLSNSISLYRKHVHTPLESFAPRIQIEVVTWWFIFYGALTLINFKLLSKHFTKLKTLNMFKTKNSFKLFQNQYSEWERVSTLAYFVLMHAARKIFFRQYIKNSYH